MQKTYRIERKKKLISRKILLKESNVNFLIPSVIRLVSLISLI